LDERDGLNKALGLGGAIEAFLEAKEEGVIRYIGISADSGARLHKNEMDLVVRKALVMGKA
jgi:diketogulonate reductase-like aldo/keto reductase